MCDGVDIGPAACRQRGQSRQQFAPTRRLCPLLVDVKLFVRLAALGRPDHFVGGKAGPRRVRGHDCAGFVAEQYGVRPEWLVDTPTLAGVLDLDAGDQAPLRVAAPRCRCAVSLQHTRIMKKRAPAHHCISVNLPAVMLPVPA